MPKAYLDRLGDLIPGHPVLTAFPRLKTLWDVDARRALLDEFRRHAACAVARQPAAGADRSAGQDARPGALRQRRARRDLPQASRPFPGVHRLAADEQCRGFGEGGRSRGEGARRARRADVHQCCRQAAVGCRSSGRCFSGWRRTISPVWVHPMRTAQFSDYASEKESQNEIWFSFGWPYETTACMTRLIYSGIFDELPTLKIVSHHMGGMIPYLLRQDQTGLPADFLRRATDRTRPPRRPA